MQSAKDRNSRDGADRRRRAEILPILVQGEMRPDLVVVRSVSLEDMAQLNFAEHDKVVKGFATYRPDVTAQRSRSATGEPGAVGRSRIPIARMRRAYVGPKAPSRSRIR